LTITVLSLMQFRPAANGPPTCYAGGHIDDRDFVYRYKPYSLFRQYFPSDDAGYLKHVSPSERFLNGWRLRASGGAVAQLALAETCFPLQIEIKELAASGDISAVALQHAPCKLAKGAAARLSLRGTADVPHGIRVAFLRSGDANGQVAVCEAILNREARSVSIVTQPAPHDEILIPVIWLASQPGSVTIHELRLEGPEGLPDSAPGEFYVESRINKWGYRERDIDPDQRDDVRIACLGDSFTFGQGVHVEDAFPSVLESLLNQERPSGARRIEVLNFGVLGYSTDIERLVLEQIATYFQPRIVVVTMCWNDAVSFHEEAKLMTKVGQTIPTYDLRGRIQDRGFAACIDELRAMNAFCEQRSWKLVVGIFNNTDNAEWKKLVAEVLPAMKATGVTAFDIRDELVAAGAFDRQGVVYRGDEHPNARAHAVYARKLAAAIKQAAPGQLN
jgi:lysophospholipase L1-like esterase